MRILIIGWKGGMGQRYRALLENIGIDVVGIDSTLGTDLGFYNLNKTERSKLTGNGFTPLKDIKYDKAIIATPTNTHYDEAVKLAILGKPFLCEKPVSKNPADIDDIIGTCKITNTDARMVCNWAFTCDDRKWNAGGHEVFYDCYNTGRDGLHWDCIQLIYLAKNDRYKLNNKSPFFEATIDKQGITLQDIQWSYHRMLTAWIHTPEKLWDMEDAKKATEKVLGVL